ADQVAQWVEAQAAQDGQATLWLREIALPPPDAEGVDFDGRGLRIRREILIPHAAANVDVHVLAYHASVPPHLRLTPTAVGGVLEDLRHLSVMLARRYAWSEGQATTFVLTGRSPYLNDVRASFERGALPSTSRISLQLDPTLSPREVAERYRTVRE